MKVSDDSQSRRISDGLWAISREGRATIEGVEIDLRHSELSPDFWFCSQVQRWYFTPFTAIDSPALFFPWNDRQSFEERLQEWSTEIENNSAYPELNAYRATLREPARKREQAKRIREQIDREFVVSAGDTLKVSRVVTIPIGDVLEHLSDREKKLAYLEIIRGDGTQTFVPDPIHFFRHSSFKSGPTAHRLSFNTIALRICEANEIGNLFDLCLCAESLAETIDEFSSEKVELTWPEGLLQSAQKLAVDLEAIACRADGVSPNFSDWARTAKGSWPEYWSKTIPGRSDVERLLNDAVALGYQWKQYEADTLMGAPAQTGIAVTASRKRGGEKRGEYRKNEARTIREIVLELAIEFRARRPSLSQEELATAICNMRRKGMPSHRTIVGHISMLEKSGKLPKRENRR